jgi:hypothetical protein
MISLQDISAVSRVSEETAPIPYGETYAWRVLEQMKLENTQTFKARFWP